MGFCWYVLAVIYFTKTIGWIGSPVSETRICWVWIIVFWQGRSGPYSWLLCVIGIASCGEFLIQQYDGIGRSFFCCSCHKTIRVVNGKQGQHLGITGITTVVNLPIWRLRHVCWPRSWGPQVLPIVGPLLQVQRNLFHGESRLHPKTINICESLHMYSPFLALCGPKRGCLFLTGFFGQLIGSHIWTPIPSYHWGIRGGRGGGGDRTRYDLQTTEPCAVVVFLKLQDACTISVAWFETWRSWRHGQKPCDMGEAIIMVARDDVCSDPKWGSHLEPQNLQNPTHRSDVQPTGVEKW